MMNRPAVPAEMTSRQRVLTALSLGQPDRVPFADDVNSETRAALMDRADFTEVEFARSLGLDAIDCRDAAYYAPFFCAKTVRGGHEYLGDGLIKTERDLERMVFPDPGAPGFFDDLNRFVERCAPSGLATFVYVSWGVEGVLNSMGTEALCYALYDQPSLVERILDRYAEWNCRVLEGVNRSGVDFLSTYNNIAYNSGPLVSPQVFREVFLPRLKRVAGACRLPWVFHGDGNLMPIMDDLLSLGMNGLHPIQPGVMDLAMVKEHFGHRVCLWGNVDLTYTLTRGTAAETAAAVADCIRIAAPGGGYILGSSNCLPPYCKTENIWAMAAAVKKYGRYPLALGADRE